MKPLPVGYALAGRWADAVARRGGTAASDEAVAVGVEENPMERAGRCVAAGDGVLSRPAFDLRLAPSRRGLAFHVATPDEPRRFLERLFVKIQCVSGTLPGLAAEAAEPARTPGRGYHTPARDEPEGARL